MRLATADGESKAAGSMMIDNMIMGAILVFVVLSLFLRVKVAFWVIVGLPVCFLGALWLMPAWPVTMPISAASGAPTATTS